MTLIQLLKVISYFELLSVQVWALQCNLEEFGRDNKLVNGLELIRMCKWYTISRNFHLEFWNGKHRATFLEFPFVLENFHWEEPKRCVPSTFQTEFPKILCK